MTERDPLTELLHEWQPPAAPAELEGRIVDTYRAEFRSANFRLPIWRRWWTARINVPVPLMVAAMLLFALFFWLHSTPTPSTPPDAAGLVTRVNAAGFEPLPNGEARSVRVKEAHQ